MSPVLDSKLPVIAATAAMAARAYAVQKLNNVSELCVDRRAWNQAETGRRGARRDRRAPCSSTEQAVPFRHDQRALRLNASFVAQVLGQAMDDNGEMSSDTLTAYDRQPLAACFCDRYL